MYQAGDGTQELFIFQQTRPLTSLRLHKPADSCVAGVTWLAPIVQIFPL